jgi:hypothetical protein
LCRAQSRIPRADLAADVGGLDFQQVFLTEGFVAGFELLSDCFLIR